MLSAHLYCVDQCYYVIFCTQPDININVIFSRNTYMYFQTLKLYIIHGFGNEYILNIKICVCECVFMLVSMNIFGYIGTYFWECMLMKVHSCCIQKVNSNIILGKNAHVFSHIVYHRIGSYQVGWKRLTNRPQRSTCAWLLWQWNYKCLLLV